MSYNILTEPFIPLSDGRYVSLIFCLEHAHELQRISCSTPLETYAVCRFLCAFAMDAFQLPHYDARMALLERGRFDMEIIRAYIRQCENEGVSFDLFDPDRPFLQAACDPAYDQETKPAALIDLQVPSGNNHIFFEHHWSDTHSLTPAKAMRCLLTSYLFCTAAAQGYPSSVNNTPCLYVLIHGDNLFETLVLSMISIKEAGNLPYGLPAWRNKRPVTPKETYASVTLLEGMTWQPRRIRLLADDSGHVCRLYYMQGKDFKGNPLWRDPHVPYRLNKDGTYSSIKPASGRSLWRDLGAMAVSRENRFGRQPQIVARYPSERGLCRMSIVGLITSNATLVDTLYEEMLIPSEILNDEEKGDMLHVDLNYVEAVSRLIHQATGSHVPASLAEDLQNQFLAFMRAYLFGEYFDQLLACASDAEYLSLMEKVNGAVYAALQEVFHTLSLRLGYDARNIILQSNIQKHILSGYKKLRKERNNG